MTFTSFLAENVASRLDCSYRVTADTLMLAVEANLFKTRNWYKQATVAPKRKQNMSQNYQNITNIFPKINKKGAKGLPKCINKSMLGKGPEKGLKARVHL